MRHYCVVPSPSYLAPEQVEHGSYVQNAEEPVRERSVEDSGFRGDAIRALARGMPPRPQTRRFDLSNTFLFRELGHARVRAWSGRARTPLAPARAVHDCDAAPPPLVWSPPIRDVARFFSRTRVVVAVVFLRRTRPTAWGDGARRSD